MTATRAPRLAALPAFGRAPELLALSSLGVLMVALAYAGGRAQEPGAAVAYWAGQVVVFTPIAARLLFHRAITTSESFLLVMGLAVNQYVLKWTYSPDQLRFPDELQHWAATTIIMDTGRLFQPNPALPPAVNFPGLAELGAAVSGLTGLSVTAAGLLVAGAAHLTFVGVLFLVVLGAGGSAGVAGLTCVLYATSLHYLFFDSMYLYQTAALPFLMVTIWAFLRRHSGWPFAVVGLAAVVVTTVSHHVTAFVMVGTLALLAVCELLLPRPAGWRGWFRGPPRRWAVLLAPGVAAVVVVGWLALVATDVVGYLGDPVRRLVTSAGESLTGAPTGGPAVTAVPVWQLAIQAVGLLGLLAICVHEGRAAIRSRSVDPWRLALLIGVFGFFAITGVRFIGAQGPEIAGRASTFTYLPVSMLTAAVLLRWTPRRPRMPRLSPVARRTLVGAAFATLLMIGARVGGYPSAVALLPGPYRVSAYELSVDDYNVAASDWALAALGRGHRFTADVTGTNLLSTYGGQDAVRQTASLYYSTTFTEENRKLMYGFGIEYLWVDLRLAEQLPQSGSYFEPDPQAGRHPSPLPLASLIKFDAVAGMDRVYDGGRIRIYQVGLV